MIILELATWAWWLIYLGISIGAIVLVGLVFFLLFGLRKKREGQKFIKIDDEFIQKLILALGGKENINGYQNENGRVKFQLNDIKLLDREALKELSTSGAFIVSNSVKLLFKYEADVVMANLGAWL